MGKGDHSGKGKKQHEKKRKESSASGGGRSPKKTKISTGSSGSDKGWVSADRLRALAESADMAPFQVQVPESVAGVTMPPRLSWLETVSFESQQELEAVKLLTASDRRTELTVTANQMYRPDSFVVAWWPARRQWCTRYMGRETLPTGTLLFHYAGIVRPGLEVDSGLATHWHPYYRSEEVDETGRSLSDYIIDATRESNFSRFVIHSHNPTAALNPRFDEGGTMVPVFETRYPLPHGSWITAYTDVDYLDEDKLADLHRDRAAAPCHCAAFNCPQSTLGPRFPPCYPRFDVAFGGAGSLGAPARLADGETLPTLAHLLPPIDNLPRRFGGAYLEEKGEFVCRLLVGDCVMYRSEAGQGGMGFAVLLGFSYKNGKGHRCTCRTASNTLRRACAGCASRATAELAKAPSPIRVHLRRLLAVDEVEDQMWDTREVIVDATPDGLLDEPLAVLDGTTRLRTVGTAAQLGTSVPFSTFDVYTYRMLLTEDAPPRLLATVPAGPLGALLGRTLRSWLVKNRRGDHEPLTSQVVTGDVDLLVDVDEWLVLDSSLLVSFSGNAIAEPPSPDEVKVDDGALQDGELKASRHDVGDGDETAEPATEPARPGEEEDEGAGEADGDRPASAEGAAEVTADQPTSEKHPQARNVEQPTQGSVDEREAEDAEERQVEREVAQEAEQVVEEQEAAHGAEPVAEPVAEPLAEPVAEPVAAPEASPLSVAMAASVDDVEVESSLESDIESDVESHAKENQQLAADDGDAETDAEENGDDRSMTPKEAQVDGAAREPSADMPTTRSPPRSPASGAEVRRGGDEAEFASIFAQFIGSTTASQEEEATRARASESVTEVPVTDEQREAERLAQADLEADRAREREWVDKHVQPTGQATHTSATDATVAVLSGASPGLPLHTEASQKERWGAEVVEKLREVQDEGGWARQRRQQRERESPSSGYSSTTPRRGSPHGDSDGMGSAHGQAEARARNAGAQVASTPQQSQETALNPWVSNPLSSPASSAPFQLPGDPPLHELTTLHPGMTNYPFSPGDAHSLQHSQQMKALGDAMRLLPQLGSLPIEAFEQYIMFWPSLELWKVSLAAYQFGLAIDQYIERQRPVDAAAYSQAQEGYTPAHLHAQAVARYNAQALMQNQLNPARQHPHHLPNFQPGPPPMQHYTHVQEVPPMSPLAAPMNLPFHLQSPMHGHPPQFQHLSPNTSAGGVEYGALPSMPPPAPRQPQRDR
eukprot:CAMPEP_0170731920 /NCGR_PEP_ID=MMETSP0437-20130122/1291_1 /TAXON_ID=0 /ORGANISM="Sexangularia sp." /LENGTH=1224 /DNA_ID=CAMNT_0011070153 /DNA_START=33 /DNA_END=3707 /DNA_ORIENTATION=+